MVSFLPPQNQPGHIVMEELQILQHTVTYSYQQAVQFVKFRGNEGMHELYDYCGSIRGNEGMYELYEYCSSIRGNEGMYELYEYCGNIRGNEGTYELYEYCGSIAVAFSVILGWTWLL